MLVKPETLKIGHRYRLTGDACNETERADTNTYEVVNVDLECKTGAHLIVKDDAGVEHECRIMPWVKVILV